MNFIIDIDDTILESIATECEKCGRNTYKLNKVFEEEIEQINYLYDEGHIIIFFTGRNWDCFKQTAEQLKKAGVKYHSLVMGKPQGVYIDTTDSEQTIQAAMDKYKLC